MVEERVKIVWGLGEVIEAQNNRVVYKIESSRTYTGHQRYLSQPIKSLLDVQ